MGGETSSGHAHSREQQLVDLALDYSLSITSQDTLIVRYEDMFSAFGKLIIESARRRDAQVIDDPFNLQEERARIERHDIRELKDHRDELIEMANRCTARVRVDAESDPYYLAGVDSHKAEDAYGICTRPYIDRIVGTKEFPAKKWLVLGYPSEAQAKIAGKSFEAWSDFIFSASLRDWSGLEKLMQEKKKMFDDAHDVHIYVPGMTNLYLSLHGRGADVCAGKHNMPDGEFYYWPVENSLNGRITFPYKTAYEGNEVEGVELFFHDGVVVKGSAKKGNDFLQSFLQRDGCNRAGEFGIGCNTGITQPTGEILYDEKMGGTVHIALGNSYEGNALSNGGGLNKANGHWDMICDLREGGQLRVNGEIVQKDGIWL